MENQTKLIEDLRQLIADRKVVALVGAGVSMGASGEKIASWNGLLGDGVKRAATLNGFDEKWIERKQADLKSGDLDEMLGVAELITKKVKDGEYARWLREAFKKLPINDRTVLEALRDLKIPIVTTNYDGLIEEVTGLPMASWKEKHKIGRIVRGEDQAVLHLHGHWDQPESVILGIRDYEEVRTDEHTRAVMDALDFTKSLLFIGCGEGLNDPNFGPFLKWMEKVKGDADVRNYRLCLDSEVTELEKDHPDGQRIFPLGYGAKHDQLAGFLQDLQPHEDQGPPVAPPCQLDPALDAYLQHLCEAHGKLRLFGFGASLQAELPIQEAYVPLQACHYDRGELMGRFDDKAMHAARDSEIDVKLENMFRAAAKDGKRGVILLG